ncbi:MAG: MBL fold metallo-hydrolase [Candidatus Aminicenantes bacterium]|nr:MBL fold metallo-hydrolase [Candidatus Aminicenantes bacterium]
MEYEIAVVGALETNCYIVYCQKTHACAVVDPGAEPEKIIQIITKNNLNPVALINTHGHVDHIGSNKDIKEKYNVPLYIHQLDSPMLESVHLFELSFILGAKDSPPADKFLQEGDEISIGEGALKVIHTPGHSRGSVSLLGDGFILSGDTLFFGGVGRTDLPGGNWEELEDSIINKILTLPEDIIVLPGHGPSTTVGKEKSGNSFIK